MKRRIVIGISGASGAPLAVALLKELKKTLEVQTHLVYSKGAQMTLRQETDITLEELEGLADCVYDNQDIGAAIASGSFQAEACIIVPCSMKTLAGIACGYSDNLLLRAADVALKERRRLILVTRECPLGPVHLKNMLELSRMGAVILPPVLCYYSRPKTIEDVTNHMVGKIMDSLGIAFEGYERWNGWEQG